MLTFVPAGRPIGIVVFYGMLVSVFLTLLAVPTVYAILARKTRSPRHVSRLVDRLMGNRGAVATPAPQQRRDEP